MTSAANFRTTGYSLAGQISWTISELSIIKNSIEDYRGKVKRKISTMQPEYEKLSQKRFCVRVWDFFCNIPVHGNYYKKNDRVTLSSQESRELNDLEQNLRNQDKLKSAMGESWVCLENATNNLSSLRIEAGQTNELLSGLKKILALLSQLSKLNENEILEKFPRIPEEIELASKEINPQTHSYDRLNRIRP